MEKGLRDNISEDCKRLIRESRKLIKRSREFLGSDGTNELSRRQDHAKEKEQSR